MDGRNRPHHFKRLTDADSINRALFMLSQECMQHERCKGCRLFKDYDCLLNCPPAHFQIGEIIARIIDYDS